MLSKNALQNVMEFFRPWGRDFETMRTINKRIKAAYDDHLKYTVNIRAQIANFDEKVLQEE